MEAALVVPADVGVDAAHREVHLRKSPGRVVALLPVDRDVADATAVLLDELLGLDEHASRAAAGVIDPPLVRLQHLDQESDDATRRVELTPALALRAGKSAEEILVHSSENVAGAVGLLGHTDLAHEVDELSEHDLVQCWARVVLGQDALERSVVGLDRHHGVVDVLANRRLLGPGLEIRPSRFLRDPEDVLGEVLLGDPPRRRALR